METDQAVYQFLWTLKDIFNPDSDELRDTPERVAKMWREELLSGYSQDPAEVFKVFDGGGYRDLILVKGLPFYSICEHHLLPFIGLGAIGYIPHEKVIGLSKLARVLEIYSRRLQIQERLTCQVADCLYENLKPLGVIVILEAEHLCMTMRGVQKPGATSVTSALRGAFEWDSNARAEALSLLKNGGSS